MQAQRRQIIVDSRLPVGKNTNPNDPTHPRNLTLLAANTEAQAAADQRYDINPPPRVEGFSMMVQFSRLPFLLNVFLICLLLVAVFQIKQRILKIIISVCIIFLLHTAVGQFPRGDKCGMV